MFLAIFAFFYVLSASSFGFQAEYACGRKEGALDTGPKLHKKEAIEPGRTQQIPMETSEKNSASTRLTAKLTDRAKTQNRL